MQQPEKLITIPFASQGDKTDVATTPNPNIVNYPQGYSQNFELPLGAGGQAIQRQGFNGLLYDITNILQYMQFGNKPTFDSRIAAAGGYPLGAVLTYYPDNANPDTSYEVISMKANNTDDFVTTPSFIGTSWLPYNQGISMSGSNSNGFYFKFTNGLIIQWTAPSGVLNVGKDPLLVMRTFPVPFANKDYLPFVTFTSDDFNRVTRYNFPNNKKNTDSIGMYLDSYGTAPVNINKLIILAAGFWK